MSDRYALESQGFHVPDQIWKHLAEETQQWLLAQGERIANSERRAGKAEAERDAHLAKLHKLHDLSTENLRRAHEAEAERDQLKTDREADAECIRDLTAGMNSLAAELEALREQVRWRKWPDEKPPEGKMVIWRASNREIAKIFSGPYDTSKSEGLEYHWLPIPTTGTDDG